MVDRHCRLGMRLCIMKYVSIRIFWYIRLLICLNCERHVDVFSFAVCVRIVALSISSREYRLNKTETAFYLSCLFLKDPFFQIILSKSTGFF